MNATLRVKGNFWISFFVHQKLCGLGVLT